MGCSRECFPVSSAGEHGRKFRYEKQIAVAFKEGRRCYVIENTDK